MTARARPNPLREFRAVVRQALADYMDSEGCGCCGDRAAHEASASKLAKLLKVPVYSDSSGHDFGRFRTKE